MKQVKLKQLTLTNFKGVRERTFAFDGKSATISGTNGVGKSTTEDALWWLLSGKDSDNSSDFEIKTLDKDNQPIHKLEHSVEGKFEVNGVPVELKRTFKEKWVKQRGETQAKFQGHETTFFVNGVAKSATEYASFITTTFAGETVVKTLTSPTFFNTLDWKERRKILVDMVGEISFDEVVVGCKDPKLVKEVFRQIPEFTDPAEYAKQLAAKRKPLSELIKTIPARISEAKLTAENIPASEHPVEILQTAKATAEKRLEELSQAGSATTTANADQYNQISKLTGEVETLKNQYTAIQGKRDREYAEKLNAAMIEADKAKSRLQNIEEEKPELERRKATQMKLLEGLREDWGREHAKQLLVDDSSLECPACKRRLENAENVREKLVENFNQAKANALREIEKNAENVTAALAGVEEKLTEYDLELSVAQEAVEQCNLKINEINSKVDEYKQPNAEQKELIAKAEGLKKQIAELKAKAEQAQAAAPENAQAEAISKRAALFTELQQIMSDLALADQKAKAEARVEELLKEEAENAQALADIERTELALDQFSRAKMTLVEGRVNEKFQVVKWKLFETQINGGEAPCCTPLVDGVPFSQTNTAGQINAGIDIAHGLSQHFGIVMPVIVDRAESIVQIANSPAQIIRLKVDEKVKELELSFN